MSLKNKKKKLSCYAKYKKKPHVYSEPFLAWSRDPGPRTAHKHNEYLMRVNGWRKMPGEDVAFMRANLERLFPKPDRAEYQEAA